MSKKFDEFNTRNNVIINELNFDQKNKIIDDDVNYEDMKEEDLEEDVVANVPSLWSNGSSLYDEKKAKMAEKVRNVIDTSKLAISGEQLD